jgi:hypothetical protein
MSGIPSIDVIFEMRICRQRECTLQNVGLALYRGQKQKQERRDRDECKKPEDNAKE